MFLMVFSYVARALQLFVQSLNNNNWPNKNNDVITDLGGGGNFPMFRCTLNFLSALPDDSRAHLTLAPRGGVTTPASKSWASP